MSYTPEYEPIIGARRLKLYYNTEFPPATRDLTAPLTVMLASADEQAPNCKGDPDPDRWFARQHGHDELRLMERLCKACPLRQACLNYAMDNLVDGFWAGTTATDRARGRAAYRVKGKTLAQGKQS